MQVKSASVIKLERQELIKFEEWESSIFKR